MILIAIVGFVSWVRLSIVSTLATERGALYASRIHALWDPAEFASQLPYSEAPHGWVFKALDNPVMSRGPYLVAFAIRDSVQRPAVLILPGGGYQFRSEKEEGIEVAAWLLELGVNSYVLNYRLDPHPAPIMDGRLAIAYLRANADRLGIDPDKVGVLGFSAGGHLAASLSTLYTHPKLPDLPDSYSDLSLRPDFTILAYPVVSLTDQITHQGSKMNLLGERPSTELVSLLSAEHHVDADTPPAFVWAPRTDEAVSFENSQRYADALAEAGVDFELHLFPEGAHGSALAQDETYAAQWPILLERWLQKMNILVPNAGNAGTASPENT